MIQSNTDITATGTTAAPPTTSAPNILATDSATADSMPVQKIQEAIPVLDTIAEIPAKPAAYLYGHEPAARPSDVATDPTILCAFAIVMLTLIFNFRHIKRLLASGAQELLSVRSRENVFDDHTANESRAGVMLVVQLCLCSGTLLYLWITQSHGIHSSGHQAAAIWTLTALSGVYYIFQFTAYSTVGYTFAPDKNSAHQWVKGFTSSFSYLSVAALIPALTALFYPDISAYCAITMFTIFCIAKLVFIIKGFRIFYYNISSLLYLFLYLCSLEIIPVIFVYSLSLFLTGVDAMPII